MRTLSSSRIARTSASLVSHWGTLASSLALAPLEGAREAESPLSPPRISSTSGSSARYIVLLCVLVLI